MNVVVYARVSTDIQDYNRQLNDVKSYCNAYNYIILKEFSEKQSGRIKHRAEVKSMLEYITNNDVQYLVVSELSRLGRTTEVLYTIEQLNELKVGLISIKENIKTLNDDKSINHTTSMIVSILSSINSYEIETMKYRQKSGLINAVQTKGIFQGAYLPYGYMRENKSLSINPVEAEIVKEIFNLYVNGYSTFKIANYLNEKEIPSKTNKYWHDAVIYQMLKNPIYKGKRIYNKTIADSPIIIDNELFDKVQHLRVTNRNKSISKKKYYYLLDDGIITCGICGKTYFAHKRANLKDNTYKCISIRYRNNCGNVGISIPKLENSIKQVLIKKFSTLLLNNIDTTEINSNIENTLNQLSYCERLLKKEYNNESQLIDLKLNGISETTFNSKLKEIRSKQSSYSNDITKHTIQLQEYKDLLNKAYNLKLLANEFNPTGITKELVRKIVSKIVLTIEPNIKLSNVPNDKTLKINLYVGTANIEYYISQRSSIIHYNNS